MIFRQLFDRASSTYTYLLGSVESGEATIIDPVLDNTELYLELSRQLGLKMTLALDTHTHADHVTALGTLRDACGCHTMLGKQSQVACVSKHFSDGDKLGHGELELTALHTPGHTDDSYSFYWPHPQQASIFTGDTLLIRGSGRTDFQNGDARQQYQSLTEKLLTLPGSTFVYPGHDYRGMTRSTIAEEKQFNPRLQVASIDEYEKVMQSLKLPHPAQMDVAIPANRACGQTLSGQ